MLKLKAICLFGTLFLAPVTQALPPPEDVPEEILRTEIILSGRSPINGQILTASEYAQIQNKITNTEPQITLNSQLRELIFLLRLRKLWKTITPF